MKLQTTVEPRCNEPLVYNEVLGITNDFLYPSKGKIKYRKNNLDITKPRYSEQILPWPFVISRFQCTSLVPVTSQSYSRWPGFYAIGKDSRLPDGTSLKSEFVLKVGFLARAQEQENSTISLGFL